jgi:hypothetical protein
MIRKRESPTIEERVHDLEAQIELVRRDMHALRAVVRHFGRKAKLLARVAPAAPSEIRKDLGNGFTAIERD